MGPLDRWLLRLAAGAVILLVLGLGVWQVTDWIMWRSQVTAILNAAGQAASSGPPAGPPASRPPASR